MRTSHCQNMTDICTAKVFATNPFHLLGLSPFANARTVRRRKEELLLEQDNPNQWKKMFKHLLGNTPIPTPETVEEAFRRIEDPQHRIVDEFFWFWPLDDRDDEALEALQEGKKTTAERIWKREEKSGDIRRSISAKHNVAIYNHFYAIDAEWQFIESQTTESESPADHKAMCKLWDEALSRWEDLADDEDLWEVVRARVSEIGDQRLTTGYVRRMRDEFPVAFDRINGDIAVAHAKIPGHRNDTERHLRYMNETHQGLDDVQATLDAVFDPLEREVELMAREAERVLNSNPHGALSAARTFLSNSEGIRNIVTQMLSDSDEIWIKIFDKIAATCNRCQVAYGNKTEQWEECVNFLKEVIPLACSEELQNVMKKNLEIVTKNFEEYKRDHYCWFCQKHPADSSCAIKIKMYGDVQIQTQPFSSQYRATWRNITVTVPKCRHCEEAKRAREQEAQGAWRKYQRALDSRGGWNKFWGIETDETQAAKAAYDKLNSRNYKLSQEEDARQKTFPLYRELVRLKFEVGDKPSDWECQQLYEQQQRLDPFGRSRGRGYGY